MGQSQKNLQVRLALNFLGFSLEWSGSPDRRGTNQSINQSIEVDYHSLLWGAFWDCATCLRLHRLALLRGDTVGTELLTSGYTTRYLNH